MIQLTLAGEYLSAVFTGILERSIDLHGLNVLVPQVPGGEGLIGELAHMGTGSGPVDVLNMRCPPSP